MRRVLIANRGEIAVRIIRACRSLGLESVAIYSDADAGAAHVGLADHAVHIGPTPAAESYLNIGRVIAAAAECSADAVHPGYGFLSENAAFAEACANAGLVFIGPSPAAMRAVGDKQQAKRIADDADVPTVPTWDPVSVPADAYPVLVKAAAGGGGRGMRVVHDEAALDGALESAGREAAAGFGDGTLLVERLVSGARHVEVQVLADTAGTVLYVGDRDCSLQRRHQKVIEEAPAPGIAPERRTALGEAAVRIARAAGYVGAGTAEFLVDRDGNHYFLELNARLQVEHPATEMAFGIDLVEWQLRIARGELLDIEQSDLEAHEHAIEARLYAEDPVTYLPTGGRVLDVRLPDMLGVRVDHALVAGERVPIAYDPLLAKVIARGATREQARTTLLAALREIAIPGVITNAALLQHALQLDAFVTCTHTIDTLGRNPCDERTLAPDPTWVAAARRRLMQRNAGVHADPFDELRSWRIGAGTRRRQTGTAVSVDQAREPAPRRSSVSDIDLTGIDMHVTTEGDSIWFCVDGISYQVPRSHIAGGHGSGRGEQDELADARRAELTAPMPGTVIKTLEPGTRVHTGEAVVVLEAMKMENAIAAPFDGVVDELACKVGDLVAKGAVLAEVAR